MNQSRARYFWHISDLVVDYSAYMPGTRSYCYSCTCYIPSIGVTPGGTRPGVECPSQLHSVHLWENKETQKLVQKLVHIAITYPYGDIIMNMSMQSFTT